MEAIFLAAAGIYPKSERVRVRRLLDYGGSDMNEDIWIGKAIVVSVLVMAFFSVLFFYIVDTWVESILALVLAIGLFHMTAVLALYYKAESRANAIERVLPNFLMLISANLNSGMSPFEAFRKSSRPEFGILKDEVDRVVARTLSGEPFSESIKKMSRYVRSPILKNVTELFTEGMVSGAPLAALLSDISNDITENLDLSGEIVTKSKSYILFIAFIVVFGGPLLSSVSIHFIRTITDITAEITKEIPDISYVGGMTFGQLTLSADFLYSVTIINLAITSLIASWLMAVIVRGDDRYFLKYFIILLPACQIMFILLDAVVGLLL